MQWLKNVVLLIVTEVVVVLPAVGIWWATPERTCGNDLLAIGQGLKVYQAKKAHLPGSAGLVALVATGILDTLPIDPWGRPYLYEQREGFVHVATLGRDGVAGGDDDDEIWMLTCEPPHEGTCWLRD